MAACHKTQTLTILASHLPTNKVKMRLIYNPSGTSHARDALRIENRAEQRHHFTAGEKMKILRAVDAMVATENLPFNMAATRLGVNPKSVKTWRKNAVALSDSSAKNKLILHKGPSGIVSEVKVELIEFMEHWRLRGFPVIRMCLMRKVCKLKPEFLQKSCGARLMAISCFLMKNGLTHRVATHKARTVAARAIVVGVRACAAFPSYHLGRRSHGWGGFFVILLYILLALFLGAYHLLLHAHHRAT